jgi:PEP-CTERM motif
MKTFPFAIVLALSAGYVALAGPILDSATILNESIGTYTQDQGTAITGDYQLVEPTSGATTPEPGSLTLAAIGIVCILLSQIGRRSRRKQVQRNLIT